MDIDDILAEVDSHGVSQETRDLQQLTRAWVTERSAPELLPWPKALMKRIMDRIRQQVKCSAGLDGAHRLKVAELDRPSRGTNR